MKVVLKIVSFTVVAAGSMAMSGCMTYGNTHALVTPIGVAGYHTFKPHQNVRDIRLPEQRDPDRIAAAKAKQEQAADSET